VIRSIFTLNKKVFARSKSGQGLVEYALILVLGAVVVIVILAIIGPIFNRPAPQAPVPSFTLTDQQAKEIFAKIDRVSSEQVEIVLTLNVGAEYSYKLTVNGKHKLGWCSITQNRLPACELSDVAVSAQ
jgi:pilus assembly protein Flp/PilA